MSPARDRAVGDVMPRQVTPMKIRFWTKVRRTDGCWLWTAARDQLGYGRFSPAPKRTAMAHRVAYEIAYGPLDSSLVIDHLCRNPSCVRPEHLDAVSQRENVLRGRSHAALASVATHCKNGHEFTPENTYIDPSNKRKCNACRRIARRVVNPYGSRVSRKRKPRGAV